MFIFIENALSNFPPYILLKKLTSLLFLSILKPAINCGLAYNSQMELYEGVLFPKKVCDIVPSGAPPEAWTSENVRAATATDLALLTSEGRRGADGGGAGIGSNGLVDGRSTDQRHI